MTILSYKSAFPSQVDHPRLVKMTTDDPISLIETIGYVNNYKSDLIIALIETDIVLLVASDGVFVERVSIAEDLTVTLSRFTNQ